jgi:hypothetical protein
MNLHRTANTAGLGDFFSGELALAGCYFQRACRPLRVQRIPNLGEEDAASQVPEQIRVTANPEIDTAVDKPENKPNAEVRPTTQDASHRIEEKVRWVTACRCTNKRRPPRRHLPDVR